jgi:hypothetical protein
MRESVVGKRGGARCHTRHDDLPSRSDGGWRTDGQLFYGHDSILKYICAEGHILYASWLMAIGKTHAPLLGGGRICRIPLLARRTDGIKPRWNPARPKIAGGSAVWKIMGAT